MTRILLIGKDGQLGQELQQTLSPLGEVMGVNRAQLDLAEHDRVRLAIAEIAPDLIINAAAYTAVDRAESEPELAHAVNGIAPKAMAEAAQQIGAALVHVSTDYVFDGRQSSPYGEEDVPNPLGVYGASKLLGEQNVRQCCDRHLILRTAWVYGTYGKSNFVKTMLRLGAEREQLRVVADQIGSPTWAGEIARAIASLIERLQSAPDVQALWGTYHVTNSGVASWYDFAIAIFEEAERLGFPLVVQQVMPITTPEYPTPAQRPSYSVLACQKLAAALGTPAPHWRQSLRQMLAQLHSYHYESAYSIGR